MTRRLVIAFALIAGFAWPAIASAQKLVFVVRHAERADDPARNEEDPALSASGEARAAKIAAMLRDTGVEAIFVTQYRRTQQTAQPLAAALRVRPALMPANVGDLVNTLKTRHAGGVVLVVGHSSSVPAIVRALGGGTVTLDDDDYTSLFVVAPASGAVRIRF